MLDSCIRSTSRFHLRNEFCCWQSIVYTGAVPIRDPFSPTKPIDGSPSTSFLFYTDRFNSIKHPNKKMVGDDITIFPCLSLSFHLSAIKKMHTQQSAARDTWPPHRSMYVFSWIERWKNLMINSVSFYSDARLRLPRQRIPSCISGTDRPHKGTDKILNISLYFPSFEVTAQIRKCILLLPYWCLVFLLRPTGRQSSILLRTRLRTNIKLVIVSYVY